MMVPIRSSYSHFPQAVDPYAARGPYMTAQSQSHSYNPDPDLDLDLNLNLSLQSNPNHRLNPPYPTGPGRLATIGRSSTTNVVVPRTITQFVHQGPPDSSTESTRRRRASRPKVKTGCITCKIRHVKCDEVKPACNRCTSTGRKCDGYDNPSQDGASSNLVRRPSSPSSGGKATLLAHLPPSMSRAFPGTVQERDIFHRFQAFTIPVLNGGSESKFWTSLVLQAGIQEPVIRNAIIALATLHEDYRSRNGRHDHNLIQQPTHQRALLLYGKALRQLNERLASTQGDSAKLAIISSILFTCFEILRRNDMTAIVHYQAGMRELMRQMKLKQEGPIGLNAADDAAPKILLRQVPQDELDILLRVFARYDVQACTFAKPRAEPLASEIPAVPPQNLTLQEVRYHLDNLIMAAYQLLSVESAMYRYLPVAMIPPPWQVNVTQQLDMFQKWHDALEEFFRASEVQLSGADSKSLLGLRLQIKVAIIRLRTSISCGPEMTFDQYRPEFEEMVTSVERVTQSLALTDADPLDRENTPFTMELGIVHPLFFIATKCRDHRLRKRAIAQLRKAGKEGVWDGPIMAVLAKRMMQIEETGLLVGQTVPERNRIHNIQKSVDYSGRKIMAAMQLSKNDSWKDWEMIREAIPF